MQLVKTSTPGTDTKEWLAGPGFSPPVRCIAALDMLFSHIPVTRSFFYAKKALEVLIEAYTRLSPRTSDKADIEAALDLFDKLLARPDCRTDLDRTPSQIQRTG